MELMNWLFDLLSDEYHSEALENTGVSVSAGFDKNKEPWVCLHHDEREIDVVIWTNNQPQKSPEEWKKDIQQIILFMINIS